MGLFWFLAVVSFSIIVLSDEVYLFLSLPAEAQKQEQVERNKNGIREEELKEVKRKIQC